MTKDNQALEFVGGLTTHERSALRQFLREPVKYGNLAVMAVTHVLPLNKDPDALVSVDELDSAVLTLRAALDMMDGARARN